MRGCETHFEIVVALFETRHFRAHRSRPLDQRRIYRLRFGGAPRQVLQGRPRVAEAMLRVRQLLVRGELFLVEPSNAFASLALPRFKAAALLFCTATFDFEQLSLLLYLLQIICRSLQLISSDRMASPRVEV